MTDGKIKRILITVKPWDGRLPMTVSNASSLANSLGAEILLLSCLSRSQVVFAGVEPPEHTESSDAERQGTERETHLEELAAPLREAGVWVTTHTTSESPVYRAILDAAAKLQADLLVVGVHEHGLFGPTQFTDLDRQLMRMCPCPLLLVRNPDITSYRRILAAVDPLFPHGGPEGLDVAVARTAGQMSKALHADLCVANVHPNPDDFEIVSAVEVEPGVYYGAENIPEAHRKAVDNLLSECDVTPSETVLRSGDPSTQIVDLLGELDIDLVVLGALKRAAIRDWLLGSTAEKVAAEARSDVLLVKPMR
jgi:universal stress protein E